jgi:predicted PurR-regulated permease PerM
MVVLKKVKSATLVEALIATVLIVIVFVIASLVLNNLVLNTMSKNTHSIENRLNELAYDLQNKLLKLPYQEEYEGWNISLKIVKENSNEFLNYTAINQKSDKELSRNRIYEP